MAEAKASIPQPPTKQQGETGGHAFPFEARGMTDADRSTHVWVGFNVPAPLYLDSEAAGGLTIQSGTTKLDFKHIISPTGRCGMPVEATGVEIDSDDRGNYTYTSASACIPFRPDWIGRDYVSEAMRAVNDTIIAYREIVGRPTIPTLGPTDLSQGLTIEGPFPDPEAFLKNSGLSGVLVAGTRADGTSMLSMKGFVGRWVALRPVLGPDVFSHLQEYLSGHKKVSAARRVLQEALRELRHGDLGLAAVLGGSALEIGIQELLDRKEWQAGTKRKDTFATKMFVDPFVANSKPGLNEIDSDTFGLVERLYTVRNKVAHEGKAYYVDNSQNPPNSVVVTAGDIDTMLNAASKTLTWIENYH